MAVELQLDDIRRAWEARDPELVKYVADLATQPDKQPDTPIREGAPTFAKFLAEIRSYPFKKKTRDEQKHYRVEQLKALEAPDAEVPLPDRLKLHEIILALWNDNGPFARRCLLEIIATVELAYGPWRALKRIFKEAEEKNDTEVYGALAARIDMALSRGRFQVSRATLAYLARRAWRYLRRLGVRLPACYADVCVDFLACYTDDTYWSNTWVANHIFYHETKQYNRSSFRVPCGTDLLKHRAYAELWQRTPRPLFSLLERAKAEQVRAFATAALRADFRATLREVEPAWVARLVNVGSQNIDEFVIWILQNVPRFEQAAFRSLGLHEAVLKLFDSPAPSARIYAADYARTHARDLSVSELIRLANNNHPAVRKLAADLLLERDPRTAVGLDAWGQLLETDHGHKLAADVIRKNFGARELTPEWFKDRLFSTNHNAFQFAKSLLPQVHPREKLGSGFFAGLIDSLNETDVPAARNVPSFALEELTRFDLNELDADFLKRLLANHLTSNQAVNWVNEGKLRAKAFTTEYLKVLAYHPDFETDAWLNALKQSGKEWAKYVSFNEWLADQVLAWLRDPRQFSPADLTFDWLMKLVARGEERYHEFAVETMIKSFVPADFAPSPPTPLPPGERGEKLSPLSPGGRGVGGEGEKRETASGPAAKVDLGGATFLFTGKMATMDRKTAEAKVKESGGGVLSAVSPKLHYLVVGDEGSPLYGQGKKGNKQTKAEELNEKGANIRIISETAFLRMLSGQQQEYSEDAALAGAQRLWEMAIAPGAEDAAVARFARRYIRRHHPDICLEETDRPVDPGAEIPASFFTFERVEPLFHETRKPLREFALKLARWEFARWAPPVSALLRMCEAPFNEVRQFVYRALLADESPEHKRYRIDLAALSPAAVYSFCESPDEETRDLGMTLIERNPHLKQPEELFRLTESQDRKVRAFVIRALWSLYRDRGITPDWKPYVPPHTTVGAAARRAAEEATRQRGDGPPHRPEQLPSAPVGMRDFFRRILFEIPPGRSEKAAKDGEQEGIKVRLKPLPARRAKLYLVEVMRDLALEDSVFAGVILPLFEEFMVSRGQSEQAACLVAVTRLRHVHPSLNGTAEAKV